MEKLKNPQDHVAHMLGLSDAGKKKEVVDLTGTSPTTTTTSTTGSKKSKKKTDRFQLNTKTLFMTYPQNDTPKETALKRIVDIWEPEWAIVAQEKHKDGNNHLHAVVRFTAPMRFGRPSFADFVAEKHGNYQSARGVMDSIKYVKKAGDFVVHGVLPEKMTGNREAPTTRVAKMIMNGKNLEEIKMEEPGVFFQYRKKIDEMMQYEAAISEKDNLSQWLPLKPKPSMPPHKLELIKWLNDNIMNKHREFKQKQLWIVAPPGSGKTSMCVWLEKFCRIYWVPNEETFYDDYFDDRVDLCVFDEYKAQKTITFMNSFLQGMCPIRKKGTQYMKRSNPACIITSNYTPEECYKKSSDVALQSLHARIQVLHWPGNEFVDVSDCATQLESDEEIVEETDYVTPVVTPQHSVCDSPPRISRKRAFYVLSDDEDDSPGLPPRKLRKYFDVEAQSVE